MERQDAKTPRSESQGEEPPAHVDQIAYTTIGAAIEVHRHLGPGHPEAAYEEALVIELQLRGVHVERQVPLPLMYKGRIVSETRLDLLIEGLLVVELKSVEALLRLHAAQLLSYLKAGAFQLGLLINFNVLVLRDGIRRVISSG